MTENDATKWAAVVVAAGSGSRFGGPKLLAELGDCPVLVRTLRAIATLNPQVRVLVLAPSFLESSEWADLLATFPEVGAWHVVPGGAERALSVLAGAHAAFAQGAEIIAIHDGARPFPPREATLRALHSLQTDPGTAGAIVCAEVTDTIKRVAPDGSTIVSTENRDQLRRAETPQVCRTALLIDALSRPDAGRYRDDGEALEAEGHRVCCIVHHEQNIKITRPSDLVLARAIAAERNSP